MIRAFDAPIISNDQSLDRLLAAPIPSLILFWDGKSLPEPLSQAMIDLAKTKAGTLIIAKVNWQDNPIAANQFGLTGTITLIGVRDGKEVTRADNPKVAEINRYADYLLGNGSEPIREQKSHRSPDTPGGSRPAYDDRPVMVTDATFEQQVLKSPIPVLVDFWAPWCAPCRMVAPILDQLAKEFGGRLRIAKLNVDENPHFAGRYGVQGIPTMLFIQNGAVVDRIVGAASKQHLLAKLNTLL